MSLTFKHVIYSIPTTLVYLMLTCAFSGSVDCMRNEGTESKLTVDSK